MEVPSTMEFDAFQKSCQALMDDDSESSPELGTQRFPNFAEEKTTEDALEPKHSAALEPPSDNEAEDTCNEEEKEPAHEDAVQEDPDLTEDFEEDAEPAQAGDPEQPKVHFQMTVPCSKEAKAPLPKEQEVTENIEADAPLPKESEAPLPKESDITEPNEAEAALPKEA